MYSCYFFFFFDELHGLHGSARWLELWCDLFALHICTFSIHSVHEPIVMLLMNKPLWSSAKHLIVKKVCHVPFTHMTTGSPSSESVPCLYSLILISWPSNGYENWFQKLGVWEIKDGVKWCKWYIRIRCIRIWTQVMWILHHQKGPKMDYVMTRLDEGISKLCFRLQIIYKKSTVIICQFLLNSLLLFKISPNYYGNGKQTKLFWLIMMLFCDSSNNFAVYNSKEWLPELSFSRSNALSRKKIWRNE